jgi:SAGA-associated factor 11
VASEAHRAARLGFDYRLRNEEDDETHTCASARATLGDVDSSASENSGRYTVDVFEQTHPTIALEMFDCMNCGRPIVAGRFAPHLEKCMGKGRKARLKPNSNTRDVQLRRCPAAVPASRISNDNAARHYSPSVRPIVRAATQEPQRSTPEVNGTVTTGGSPVTDKVFISSFS